MNRLQPPPATDAYRFLGEEFLTWLWYRAEEHGGTFRMADGREIGAALDRHLEFRDDLSDARLSVRALGATRSAEASAALRTGKRLSRAHLLLGEGEHVYEMTLDAGTLDLGTLKPPPKEPGAEDLESDILRLTGAGELVDLLFQLFLETRLAPEWTTTVLPDMRRWARTHGMPTTPAAH